MKDLLTIGAIIACFALVLWFVKIGHRVSVILGW